MPTKTLYQTRWFSINLNEDGEEFLASSGDEVLIVPVTDTGEVLLSLEPSAAFGGKTLLLPGGQVEAALSHAEQANRELQEEIGYRAERLDFLAELRPWSKYLSVRSFVYLGRELSESKLVGDEEYEIGIEGVPLSNFEPLIRDGRLADARVIAALYLARSFIDTERRVNSTKE